MADIPISAVTRRVQYTVGGTDTGPYSFTFNVLADTDLAVYLNSTLKTITTHYTVSLNANGTGSITLTSSPLTTDIVTIISAVPIARVSDYTTGGDFTAAAVNADLDKQTIFSQQLSERIDRSLKSATSESAVTDWDLPAPEAEKALKWNSAGTALENSTDDIDSSATDAAASAAAALVSENAAAADAVLTAADVVTVAADLVATNQDTIDTAADLVATNQDTIDTAADVVLTAADVVSAESAAGAVAVPFTFDNSTSMADPGTGDFRFNNATVGSVTAITLDANSADTGNPDVSDFIATWGASDSGDKAHITFKKSGTPATFATFKITAAVTDNTTHLELTVTHVDSNGTWTAADKAYVAWTRTGDAGAASPSASETVEGIVETATQAEVDAGTDALRYVTPATLASTTVVGGDPAAFSGAIETDRTYVAVTQPFVMPDGSGTYIATVKDAGADGTVELWKIDVSGVVGGSATASVTLTGAATVTSIAESMGYIIVGSEDGISIVHSYDTGSWAEATTGWPRSLSTSTTPALTNNDVTAVGANTDPEAPPDPRTGGKIPLFGVGYGTGADIGSFLKWDGNIWHRAGTVGNTGVAVGTDGHIAFADNDAGDRYLENGPASVVTADDPNSTAWARTNNDLLYGLGSGNAVALHGSTRVSASDAGLTLADISGRDGGYWEYRSAIVNRTYNSGYMMNDIRGAWLANSKTADRSYKANTLTETGTVPSAAVSSGSDLQVYGPFSTSNYLSRATDADYNALASGAVHVAIWGQTSTGNETAFSIGRPDFSRRVELYVDSSGVPTVAIIGASGTTALIATGVDVRDGIRHKYDIVRVSNTEAHLYIDGVLVESDTTDSGSISDGTIILTIGIAADKSSRPWTGDLALTRLSASAPSAAQVRAMYNAEQGMGFDGTTNVLSLLQSGTTDAVLDVDVDPNGKVAVTQTDSMTIWDGLTCTTQATLGANTAFEHLKSWNDTLIEVGATDLSISRPAEITRTVFDEVKVLQNEFAGVDLSKAAAWCAINASGVIEASYNIESVNHESTGTYVFHFATKMKSKNFATVLMTGTSATGSTGNIISELNGYGSAGAGGGVKTYMTDNASTSNANTSCSIIVFGEREGE